MEFSQWRGADGADVTRERAISVAEVTQPGFTGLSFHTSKYLDEPVCPPIIIFMFICTIMFVIWLAFATSFFYLVLVQEEAGSRTSARPS